MQSIDAATCTYMYVHMYVLVCMYLLSASPWASGQSTAHLHQGLVASHDLMLGRIPRVVEEVGHQPAVTVYAERCERRVGERRGEGDFRDWALSSLRRSLPPRPAVPPRVAKTKSREAAHGARKAGTGEHGVWMELVETSCVPRPANLCGCPSWGSSGGS
ncbi:hypothetical protein QBC40DRAFT_286795 [Triangularia verruculosa]|uniref:Uncharacterized protein n=1 Tax=Triangularia verruculosa TaxID=2587418 RepID=A0AAN6X9Q4_9PEZI|nr:hypothetical protein QBC40DRAFT_286795 [Triangularia verruculosa]